MKLQRAEPIVVERSLVKIFRGERTQALRRARFRNRGPSGGGPRENAGHQRPENLYSRLSQAKMARHGMQARGLVRESVPCPMT
jgi:hypothetical protein